MLLSPWPMLFISLASSLLIFTFYLKNSKHILIALIYIEGLTLLMYWIMTMNYSESVSLLLMACLFFVVTTGSAAMGLSLLVSLARAHGEDYFMANTY